MDSSADFFDSTSPEINMSTVPSCCDYLPALYCQQTPGNPQIQNLVDINIQTHPQRILETIHGANQSKEAKEADAEGKTACHILRAKNKRGEDLYWQQKLPPVKKMKAESKNKSGEFEHRGRKKRKDREELKEQVGELKERLQTLQEKLCKALHENQRKWRNIDGEDREVCGEEGSFANEPGGFNALQGHWWNGNDSFSGDCDGEAKFAQFLKVELGSAVARVIDRVLKLYTEGSKSSTSSPSVAVSFLEAANEKWEGGVYKEAQKVDDEDCENTQSQPTEPSGPVVEQTSEGVCRKLLPQPHLHHLPAVCLSERPLLAPAPRPQAPPSSFPPPHLLQSVGPFPLFSMQELFSGTLSHQPPQPIKGFHLSTEAFSELAQPMFRPPVLDLLETAHSERGAEVSGVRGTGHAMDLYFTAGSQEGLSPCHLKKAKLMFFYTRYPSSSTLKTYFPDVKFNRCVTSQMIKWFSNFREFFYIQMERFARQAVQEALTQDGGAHVRKDRQLRVDHSSELYRILNMHYNKSNVYQVPDGFIKLSEVTLREFYAAIWTGRDSDPCWKKGIYKIICKLDSPVPDAFLLPGCPVG